MRLAPSADQSSSESTQCPTNFGLSLRREGNILPGVSDKLKFVGLTQVVPMRLMENQRFVFSRLRSFRPKRAVAEESLRAPALLPPGRVVAAGGLVLQPVSAARSLVILVQVLAPHVRRSKAHAC